MSNNQNVTPEQELASPPVESTPESIRQEHIKHEASVKSIGILYYLGASAFIVCGIASFLSQEEEALLGGVCGPYAGGHEAQLLFSRSSVFWVSPLVH
jgi:hypothetical protein